MRKIEEEIIGRHLRFSLINDDECHARDQINRVLEKCQTEEEKRLVQRIFDLVDIYEIEDEEDTTIVNLNRYGFTMTNQELGAYVLGVFEECKTDRERSLADDILIAINGWSFESLKNLSDSAFEPLW